MNTSSLKNKIKESIVVKVLIILVMILLLMIPNSIIQGLINERSNRKAGIEREVAKSFGKAQTIQPFILKIPYELKRLDKDEKPYYTNGYVSISPATTTINGELQTEMRKRSIYKVVVYNSALQIEEQFDWSYFTNYDWINYTFDYNKARLLFGVSDANGLSESVDIQVNGKPLAVKGLTNLQAKNMAWIETLPFAVDPEIPFNLTSNIEFKGTRALYFEPMGEQLTIELKSTWADPSFTGSQLPDSSDISKTGFTGNWKTNAFNHKFPQVWTKDNESLKQSYSFGVNLIQPVDEYGKNFRTSKYALLIIALTFGIFFFFETLFKKVIHPIQYTLIGFALTVFYLLLLSITEHLGFNVAYLISSFATISLIVTYTYFILKSLKGSSLLAILLVGLFSYIFIILQMQDFALLAGAIALFVILSIVMLLSRNVDWYNLNKTKTQVLDNAPA